MVKIKNKKDDINSRNADVILVLFEILGSLSLILLRLPPRGEKDLIFKSFSNGDPIRAAGEQTGTDAACSVLRVPNPRRAQSPRGRDRPQVPRSQRSTGSFDL